MKYSILTLLAYSMIAGGLSAETNVSLPEKEYNELKDKAQKWDELQQPKKDDEEKKPEPPKRSQLNVSLINDTGMKVYISVHVKVSGHPAEFMKAQASSKRDRTTMATLHAEPNSEFEIEPYNEKIGKVPGWAQLEAPNGSMFRKACELADQDLEDPTPKKAKKSITFYVLYNENEANISCYIYHDLY